VGTQRGVGEEADRAEEAGQAAAAAAVLGQIYCQSSRG
jgi:hypothetical protein